MSIKIAKIALDFPLSIFPTLFDYQYLESQADFFYPGALVHVPFSKRSMVGIIFSCHTASDYPLEKIKAIHSIWQEFPVFSTQWLQFIEFTANYYHRSLGEVALPALPIQLRIPAQWPKLSKIFTDKPQISSKKNTEKSSWPILNAQQQKVVHSISQFFSQSQELLRPILLHGITGSGKTEVYLHLSKNILQRKPKAQILILIPEINLTPQLEHLFTTRFLNESVITLHSSLSDRVRADNWLKAHQGNSQIILGTRLAIMSSLPYLSLIIVDEEHDLSYKQQEGVRYSARDLAIWRAQQLKIPIVLGSATPSLETWFRAQQGKYLLFTLSERAVCGATLPQLSLINLNSETRKTMQEGFSTPLIDAVQNRLDRREQSLIFINRRGYAPILSCILCNWVSSCSRCSARLVWHKADKKLRCHYCGLQVQTPKNCPECGNQDLLVSGRGTQRIEESLAAYFKAAKIVRIDADSTRKKGSAQALFEEIHQQNFDILVGTQMLAKGHDFQNITLVAILNADNALLSFDFRAAERLFAQLMQVSGRAGRAQQKSQVLIQTRYPQHPLYQALIAHDYANFADALLQERQQAGLPPFTYQAILRAEAKQLPCALDFLQQAKNSAYMHCKQELLDKRITLYDPVPMTMVRIADKERAQLLIESNQRPCLHRFLKSWLVQCRTMKTSVHWLLEVDPLYL